MCCLDVFAYLCVYVCWTRARGFIPVLCACGYCVCVCVCAEQSLIYYSSKRSTIGKDNQPNSCLWHLQWNKQWQQTRFCLLLDSKSQTIVIIFLNFIEIHLSVLYLVFVQLKVLFVNLLLFHFCGFFGVFLSAVTHGPLTYASGSVSTGSFFFYWKH